MGKLHAICRETMDGTPYHVLATSVVPGALQEAFEHLLIGDQDLSALLRLKGDRVGHEALCVRVSVVIGHDFSKFEVWVVLRVFCQVPALGSAENRVDPVWEDFCDLTRHLVVIMVEK